MKAPVGLVGAALLLWGFAIGLPWAGAALACGFEALRGVMAPSQAAAARLAPPARLGLLLALVSLPAWLAWQAVPQGLYAWLRWLPPMLLPLALLPLAMPQPTWAALRRALRPKAPLPPEDAREADLTHAFAALTLAAAGAGGAARAGPPLWLYAGCAAIVGWALIARQPRARRVAAAGLMVLAAAIGLVVHIGISALQGQVEEWSTELFAAWLAGPPDAMRERTRIGELGRVKLSDRIVMRVQAPPPRPDSILLREVAFDRYRGGEWQAVRRVGTPVPRAAPAGDGPASTHAWQLAEGTARSRLTVRRSLGGGSGPLPLPMGTSRIEDLPATSLDRLGTGSVRAQGTPRFIAMRLTYDENQERGAPDPALDLEVPPVLAGLLAGVVDKEQLRRPDAAATLGAVRDFFGGKFAYSLDLGNSGSAGSRALGEFLLRDHRGHCEYFATATTLLLRQLGIPARYVGGYSAQEYSEREEAFVVRARHAHAWAQAWIDGRWVNVDTTPARWAEAEQEQARGPFGPLLDLGSWLLERTSLAGLDAWAMLERDARAAAGAVFGTGAVILGLVVITRWHRRRRRREPATEGTVADPVVAAWLRVEQRAAAAGHPRAADETVRAWVRRLGAAAAPAPWQSSLHELAEAYHQARFDPACPAQGQRDFTQAAGASRFGPQT
jgi:transglutaminase-like putative cysteine protease